MAKPNYAQSGVVDQNRFAIADSSDTSKQVQFDVSPLAANKQVVIQASPSNDGVFVLPPLSGGTIASPGLNVLQYATPATTSTVTCATVTSALVVEPAATLATLTVVLPPSPADGQCVKLSFVKSITNLIVTISDGSSISNNVTASPAQGTLSFLYRLANTTWYRAH